MYLTLLGESIMKMIYKMLLVIMVASFCYGQIWTKKDNGSVTVGNKAEAWWNCYYDWGTYTTDSNGPIGSEDTTHTGFKKVYFGAHKVTGLGRRPKSSKSVTVVSAEGN